MTSRRLFLLLSFCLFLSLMAFPTASAPQTPSAPRFVQQTEKPRTSEGQMPSNVPPESLFRWADFTQPFKTKLSGISDGKPKIVLVELPAALADSDEVKLYVSTSGSGPWFYSGRVTLHVNGKPVPPFTIGPNLKLDLNRGFLKADINSLRFDFGGKDKIEVYEIRFDLPEGLVQKTKPSAPPPAKRIDATPPQDPVAAKVTEPPAAALAPAVAKKQESPPPPALEKPAPAPAIPAQPSGDPGQRWAVVIGVSAYEDSRVPSLRYASRDAQVFYDWIVSPSGGRYAPSKVKLLLDKNATSERIKDALFNWLKQAIEEDVVVIYFAGHGSPESPDAHQNLYLLPYNTKYDNIAVTGFPMWDIETALKRFIKARRVVIIADACHAAGVGQAFDVAVRADRGLQINQINSGLQNLTEIGEGVCVISASRDREFSQEGREWGGGHGVFSYYLIEGLKGAADFDKSGSVSVGEITVYVSQQVRRATRNAQNPIVAGRFDPSLVIGK